MAITYDLEFATPSSVDEVAAQLNEVARGCGLFPASSSPEELVKDGVNSRLGTWIRVGAERPQPWHPLITELHMSPTVSVHFRCATGVEVPAQQDDMIKMVSHLLQRVPGDAVLHFQLEEIWLLRRNGDLTINEREEIWPPQRLAFFENQSYRRETHTME